MASSSGDIAQPCEAPSRPTVAEDEDEWTVDDDEHVEHVPLGDAHPLPTCVLAQPHTGHGRPSANGEELSPQAGRIAYYGATYTAQLDAANPYITELHWEGQWYRLGAFPDAASAAKAYDWAGRLVGDRRKLNFGREVELGTPPATEDVALLRARVSQMGGTAALERAADALPQHFFPRYFGITRDPKASAKPFMAQIWWRRKMYNLGDFHDARSAAKAYDWAARLVDKRKLNFDPGDDLGAPPAAPGAALLRKDVDTAAAQAAPTLGPGAAAGCTRIAPTSAAAALLPPLAAAAAKRRALAAPPPSPPPAAKERRSLPEPQPAPRGADSPSLIGAGLLASQLRVLLRLRRLREDDLALDQLSEGALRDITADVRRAGPAGGSLLRDLGARLAGYSALDLKTRLAVSMRLRAISEEGVHLELQTGEIGRDLLLDLLSAGRQDGGLA